MRTLLEDPWNFWFFHKGVTALCETWKFSGADARVAPVTFRGLRIVDGAQTVSSIAAVLRAAAARLGRTRRATAEKTAAYLEAKAPYLDYPAALAAGWPIATGVIEGACRHLVIL